MSDNSVVPPPSRQSETARLTLAQLPAATSLETVFQYVCQLATAVIRVERAGIWFLEKRNTILRCVNLYELSKATHSSGSTLQVDRIPNYIASVRRRKALAVESVRDLPWTKELHEDYCNPLGISSLLDAGIFHAGVLVGIVCLEHVGPAREWTTDERDFASALADFVASRLPHRSENVRGRQRKPPVVPTSESEWTAALSEFAKNILQDSEGLLRLLEAREFNSPRHSQLFILGLDILNKAHECIRVSENLEQSKLVSGSPHRIPPKHTRPRNIR